MTRDIAHIFNLDDLDGFERAEAFKAQLEHDGWTVTVMPFGLSSVRVCGVRG